MSSIERGVAALDPVVEDAKLFERRLMGPFTKMFAPHAYMDRRQAAKNIFALDIVSPVSLEICHFPKFFTCHICGAGFGFPSLQSHLKSCQDMFERRQELKDPGEQTMSCPNGPSIKHEKLEQWSKKDIEEYNTEAREIFNVDALITCERCNRTFENHAFERHFIGCEKKDLPIKNQDSPTPCEFCGKLLYGRQHKEYHKRKCSRNGWDVPPVSKPILPCCYVCGKEYPAMVIEQHMKYCEKIWFMREGNKWPEERLDLPPKVAPCTSGVYEQQRDAKKSAMLGCGALQQCPKCNRCFFPESFRKHIVGCQTAVTLENWLKRFKAGEFNKNIAGYFNKAISKGFVPREIGVCCYICSRKFGSASIDIHIKNCINLWKIKEEEKPSNMQRIPVPIRPKQYNDFKAGIMKIGSYNSWVFDNCGSYEACRKCRRTFLMEKLPKHIRGCHVDDKRQVWK